MTQECRQTEMLAPVVKEVIRIEDASRIPELVRRAYAVATGGRPGPVVLDVPEDICHGELEFAADAFWIDEAHKQIPGRRIRPAADDVVRAAALLAKAKRPLILAGGGIHQSVAYSALQELAEALSIPVAHTMSGKGCIACTHPLSARAVRPLLAHRQRPDRDVGLPAGRRRQARRDPDQALPAHPPGTCR